MTAFDFDALSRPKRIVLDFLQKPAAAGAAHLNPGDTGDASTLDLSGEQDHLDLVGDPLDVCYGGNCAPREHRCQE
jgi:hypothetical protein